MLKKNYATTSSINVKRTPMQTALMAIFIGTFLSVCLFLSPALASQAEQNKNKSAQSKSATKNSDISKSDTSVDSTRKQSDATLAEQWKNSINDDNASDDNKENDIDYLSSMVDYGKILVEVRTDPKDIDTAFRFFRIAAERGNVEAQLLLARFYEEGKIIKSDQKKAAEWYSVAVKAKHPLALFRLGRMFNEGRGVKKDRESALLLLYGALTHGNPEAMPLLIALGEKTPPNNEILLGVHLTDIDKEALHSAMLQQDIPILREDVNFSCNIYDVSKALPYAKELSACYSSDADEKLTFLKFDYATPHVDDAKKVIASFKQQFGKPSASENKLSILWNFKTLLIVGQYMPDAKQTSLFYYILK